MTTNQGSVRLGTRGSKLSLWQARWVADRLAARLRGRRIEIVPIVTRGDVDQQPFTELSEIGVFTSELEAALHRGEVDVVVHSLKDLPVSAGALPIDAVPIRGDAADAIVSRDGLRLSELPAGARVGTSSPRRTSLVRALRPDVEIMPIRGNVDTRVRRVDEGVYDAVVLAVAGLARLGLESRISERLDPVEFPPAPGQGALAVQAGGGDAAVRGAVVDMDDPQVRATTTAERECLRAVGGGCARPVGAHAWWSGNVLSLTAVVASLDGRRVLRASASGDVPEELSHEVAASLLAQGAGALLP